MRDPSIVRYRGEFKKQVVDLVINAWRPVFEKTKNDMPSFIYDNFWPEGWQVRQVSEVFSLLETKPESVWLALQDDLVVGFVAVAVHPEDRMGEIFMIAVSPDHQRKGFGKMLMGFAERYIRDSGMKMVMVETAGDSGHEPARRTYEALGYEQLPVARYFKKL